jgi:hypothetical protein
MMKTSDMNANESVIHRHDVRESCVGGNDGRESQAGQGTVHDTAHQQGLVVVLRKKRIQKLKDTERERHRMWVSEQVIGRVSG